MVYFASQIHQGFMDIYQTSNKQMLYRINELFNFTFKREDHISSKMGINTNTHSMNLENYLFWGLNNVKNKGNLGGLKVKLHKPKDAVNVRVHVTQFENGQRCTQIQNLNSNITLQDESLNLHIQVYISNEEYHANILERSMTRAITFIVFIYLYLFHHYL